MMRHIQTYRMLQLEAKKNKVVHIFRNSYFLVMKVVHIIQVYSMETNRQAQYSLFTHITLNRLLTELAVGMTLATSI